jgi:hypothetical protein
MVALLIVAILLHAVVNADRRRLETLVTIMCRDNENIKYAFTPWSSGK